MSTAITKSVLSEEIWSAEGNAVWVKRAVMVILGIAALAVAAKIQVPNPHSPAPTSLGTFAVLTIGTAYGPRMGLTTIIGYMIIGALGFDVFSNSTAELNGLPYMIGNTGGYLVGFVVATLALGYAARRGWDRNVLTMTAAMIAASILIYILGASYLAYLYSFDIGTAFAKGVVPFMLVDAIKLAMAAMIIPMVWKFVGKARG